MELDSPKKDEADDKENYLKNEDIEKNPGGNDETMLSSGSSSDDSSSSTNSKSISDGD